MKKTIFSGCCTALVTPFYSNGKINYFTLKNLIEKQIANEISALLILGTTGEAPTITADERTKLIKFCVAEISGRVPLIVGCGSNDTNKAISYVCEAKSLGADAALVVTPYYNKCTQNGLYLHYKAIAKASEFPIIAYNVPSRTGVNILPSTIKKIAKLKHIVGLKEASGDVVQLSKILSIIPKSFAVYSGDDSLTLPAMAVGAKGLISVASNAEPALVELMCDYAKHGDFFNALKIHKRLLPLFEAMFFEVNPICIKAYLNLSGDNVGEPKPPLCKASKKTIKKLKKVREFYEN